MTVICRVLWQMQKTLTSSHIQTSVRLIIPGDMAKHAVSEGVKAVVKYDSEKTSSSGKQRGSRGGAGSPKSRSAKAGLQFPVGRVHRSLRKTGLLIGSEAPVYLAAVLEYMTAELLELSGNCARENHVMRIIPRHLLLAIRSDTELNKLLSHVTIPDAGVVPSIHPMVLNGQSESSADANAPSSVTSATSTTATTGSVFGLTSALSKVGIAASATGLPEDHQEEEDADFAGHSDEDDQDDEDDEEDEEDDGDASEDEEDEE